MRYIFLIHLCLVYYHYKMVVGDRLEKSTQIYLKYNKNLLYIYVLSGYNFNPECGILKTTHGCIVVFTRQEIV